jgi:hypothetical protein
MLPSSASEFKLGILDISLESNTEVVWIKSNIYFDYHGKKKLYSFLTKKNEFLNVGGPMRIGWDTGGELLIENIYQNTFWRVYETPEQLQALITELEIHLILHN